MTCGTCKYWGPPESWTNGYGTCKVIDHNSVSALSAAYTSCYGDAESGLFTKPTFGCVLFSAYVAPSPEHSFIRACQEGAPAKKPFECSF